MRRVASDKGVGRAPPSCFHVNGDAAGKAAEDAGDAAEDAGNAAEDATDDDGK